MADYDELPIEIWEKIFYLMVNNDNHETKEETFRNLLELRCVCQNFRIIIDSSSLLQNIISKRRLELIEYYLQQEWEDNQVYPNKPPLWSSNLLSIQLPRLNLSAHNLYLYTLYVLTCDIKTLDIQQLQEAIKQLNKSYLK
jgi:hypothetical protein